MGSCCASGTSTVLHSLTLRGRIRSYACCLAFGVEGLAVRRAGLPGFGTFDFGAFLVGVEALGFVISGLRPPGCRL